ncbi:cilia- and flagella-associated protein 91 [Nilaparvata lugens]|uniref:cilia- and flagella-associated protein 91 n=1 Tax=Nilaparvata lugens TaxID=108931 RepID=UPI00193E6196|nr:cilia- and flagella-associated protein 91 [Nilaparvata lugens]
MSTAIRSHKKVKLLPNRPLDFIYDPVFTVSNSKDYYNTVSESMKYATEFVMQPNFSSMFSEIQHYPNSSLILKSAYPIPDFIDASFKGKSRSMSKTKQSGHIEVDGADRFRYFRKPCEVGKEMVPKKPSLQYKLLLTDLIDPGSALGCDKKAADSADQLSWTAGTRKLSAGAGRGVQTDYRETETQTMPWTPPYVFHGAVTPEILTLANLSWDEGLPAGIHEVELIERARIKREWEHILMGTLKTAKDIETRQKCIIDMETNEWLFREKEIEKINSYRMELANKSMKGQKTTQFNRLDERVRRQIRRKEQQKNEQLKSLQEKKERGLILMENAPSDPAPAFNFVKASKPKTYGAMCHKLCRWSTDEDLKQLQKDLRKMNVVIGHKTHTLTKKEKVKPLLPPLLCIEIPIKQNVELHKAASFIQQLLRGRAVQYKVFQDRKRLQPLIEELKKTRSLYKEENELLSQKRYEALALMRKQFVFNRLAGSRDRTANSLNGEVTGALLDFLAKELQRLEAEKQVHAFAMLADRERWQREAIEAGRRQRHNFNRQQHDQMFKEVMNIRNESVDIFLEDMLAKSISWLADSEARHYVRNVAQKVDLAAQQAHVRKDAIEQEEMVTDLIHNYIMPDVKKAVTRHKLHENQKKYLEIADRFIQQELSLKSSSLLTESPLESTLDESKITDESTDLNREDGDSNISEAFSIMDVFKTHCLRHSKSEEAYYRLKAQNEMFASRRAKLFELAEVVKEDFLDELISRAEELAYQAVHDNDKEFVLQLGCQQFEDQFESNKHLKMAKLMVMSDILNDEFLDNLIALAKEGKLKTDGEREWEGGEESDEIVRERGLEESREENEQRIEEEGILQRENGSEEMSFHEEREEQDSSEERELRVDSLVSDNFLMNSD